MFLLERLRWIVNKAISSNKYLVLLSGFLLHCAYGSVLTFGNVTTYITSYQRHALKLDISYADTMWIQAISFATTGVALPLGGFLEKILGPRITIIISALFMSGGVFLTYFSIRHSLTMVIITYGVMFGVGARLGYMAPIAAAMRWFPKRQHGMVNGVIIAGYGLGTFIFNLIQMNFVNPMNISADISGYFVDEAVLSKVPELFILLGIIGLTIQLCAIIFITNPPVDPPVLLEMNIKVIIAPNLEMIKTPASPNTSSNLIRSPLFYALWFTFLFNDQSIIGVTGLYKAFGLSFCTDDSYLTLIGSLGSISNALGRLIWGLLSDRHEYKTLMLSLNGFVVALLLSINATPWAGIWLYGLWIILLNALIPGTYVLLPKAVRNYFGDHNVPFNYGLLFTSFLVGGPLSAIVSTKFLNLCGWIGVFWSIAAFSAFAGFITLSIP